MTPIIRDPDDDIDDIGDDDDEDESAMFKRYE